MKGFSLFGPSDEDIQDEVERRYGEEINQIRQEHELKLQRTKFDHELALKEKEFQLKHFKDNELMKVREEKAAAEAKNQVLEKENKMLQDIVDLNADIVDIKQLINKLIDKLPNVDIKSIVARTEVRK